MRDSLVDPGRQKAEKVQGDVRCLTVLRKIVHGKKVSVISFVPEKYPSTINDFHFGFCVWFMQGKQEFIVPCRSTRLTVSS